MDQDLLTISQAAKYCSLSGGIACKYVKSGELTAGKILIAAVDPKIQKLHTKVLSVKKYKTGVASDGFEAGVKVTEFRPDFVVVDLFMSRWIDCVKECRRIKENTGSSYIKILTITGYDTKENRAAS